MSTAKPRLQKRRSSSIEPSLSRRSSLSTEPGALSRTSSCTLEPSPDELLQDLCISGNPLSISGTMMLQRRTSSSAPEGRGGDVFGSDEEIFAEDHTSTQNVVELPVEFYELQKIVDEHNFLSEKLRDMVRTAGKNQIRRRLEMKTKATKARAEAEEKSESAVVQDAAEQIVARSTQLSRSMEAFPERLWNLYEAVCEHERVVQKITDLEEEHIVLFSGIDGQAEVPPEVSAKEMQLLERLLKLEDDLNRTATFVTRSLRAYTMDKERPSGAKPKASTKTKTGAGGVTRTPAHRDTRNQSHRRSSVGAASQSGLVKRNDRKSRNAENK
eukprot:Rmarinus@m.24340